MDTVLMTVTLVSLALAAALGVAVAKLLADERRRSDARVAALMEMAAESTAPRPSVPEPVVHVAARTPSRSSADVRIEDSRGVDGFRGFRVRPDVDPDDFEIRPSDAVAVSDLFAEPERTSPWGRRAAIVAGLAMVGGAAVIVLSLLRADAPVTSGGPPVATTTSVAEVPPLELISLRHTQEGETLLISGLVKNPKSGARLTRISATAVLFDAQGALLASSKAPLDYTSLAAGDESPFVVTVPIRGAVARYRVGFRAEDGSVVAHVDRRTGDVSKAGL